MPPIVFLLAVAVFAQGSSEFMLAGLLPEIAADLHITVATAGALTSAFAVGMVIGAPLMAAAGRRFPPRWTLSVFLLVFIVSHVVGALTDSFVLLLTTRITAALSTAGFLAVTLATVSALVPTDRTARAVAVILGGTTLALIAGVPAGAAIGALFGWRAAVWGIAIIATPALPAVAVFAPSRPTGSREPVSLRSELTVLRRRPLIVLLLLGAIVNGATFCAFTYLAPVITQVAELADSAVPLVLAVFGVGAFVGVFAAGRLADRHAPRILADGMVALLVGWVSLAVLAGHPVAVITLAFLQGGLAFAVGSTLITLAIQAATGAPAMSGSFATAALNVGAAVGPLVGGFVISTALGARGPLVVSAVLVVVAILVRSLCSGR